MKNYFIKNYEKNTKYCQRTQISFLGKQFQFRKFKIHIRNAKLKSWCPKIGHLSTMPAQRSYLWAAPFCIWLSNLKCTICKEKGNLSSTYSHMSGRNIWINFEAPQQYIRHINPWKKCSNLMQFLEYLAEPFLRPCSKVLIYLSFLLFLKDLLL